MKPADGAPALTETLTKAVHAALIREHFGRDQPHPAYLDPDSDMGFKARRIALALTENIESDVLAPLLALAAGWDDQLQREFRVGTDWTDKHAREVRAAIDTVRTGIIAPTDEETETP